ncbi:hypothetical protein ACLB2K_070089 [Fragaria x ananassa]
MGVSIAGASLFRSHNSDVEAEAEALLCGVKMAVLLKLEHIIVEGDCQEVIKALNEFLASPCWRISLILKKRLSLPSELVLSRMGQQAPKLFDHSLKE